LLSLFWVEIDEEDHDPQIHAGLLYNPNACEQTPLIKFISGMNINKRIKFNFSLEVIL
jgi:hypothetical protein